MDQRNSAPLLRLHKLNLVYRALPVLRELDWAVGEGEQWACLGPNGAGKTSLARVISGQVTGYSGTVSRAPRLQSEGVAYVCFEQAQALCERDRKLDDSEFRADASDPGTTVRQLVLQGRPKDAAFELWTERLRISHILGRGLRYISTGEMRKALLVSAILAQPALLLLDNPLDGLDLASQRELRAILEELPARDLQLLVLCRQASDIPDCIDQVMVLERGEVLASGPRRAVLETPAVRALLNPPLPPLAPLPPPAQRAYTLPPDSPLLELRDVAVRYGELQVLQGVNWRFERGQHCCVAGPNGCGKSTLLGLISGDNHKAYGQDITLFGVRRGSGESVWDIKQKFGLLDQQLHLNFVRGMKVLEVVVSGFFDTIGLYDAWGDRQRDTALRWLAALGLAELCRESFDALSFGHQRMVLLARAMVKSPLILLLDEPALGLDGHHRRLLLRAIDHIAAHSDTQMIYVSHSVADLPGCINQWLEFHPGPDHYRVRCLPEPAASTQ